VDETLFQYINLSISLLGVTFDTEYTVEIREAIDTPEVYCWTFTHFSDDGTIKDVQGMWYFETAPVSGEPVTYVRYFSSCRVLRKFAMQRMIMAMFNKQENLSMIRQFLKAAAGE
jgi:hypothetical protein